MSDSIRIPSNSLNIRKSPNSKYVFLFNKHGNLFNRGNLLSSPGNMDEDDIILEEYINSDKKKNRLQSILLEEKFENKYKGFIKEDIRILA